MQSTRPLRSAWLVTWEGVGNHAAVDEDKKIIAILNYRWTGERVREFVEQFHIATTSNPWDKSALAYDKRSNPYPALFGTIQGIPWSGEVFCGHNPWIYARKVKNLKSG